MSRIGSTRLAFVVLAVAGLRAVTAVQMPVLAAESYYWLWSQQLAAGFYDHPPMVALFIRAGTSLLGDTALGLRLFSVLGMTVAIGALWVFARRVVSPPAADVAALLLSVCLFALPFGIVITPDAPLLVFWALSLLAFRRAVDRPTAARWLLAGFVTGLCILSKFTGFFLVAGYGVFLVSTTRGRALLRDPRAWGALLVAALVLVPCVLWGRAHGATTFSQPFNGLEGESLGFAVRALDAARRLALVVGSALLLLTPVVLVGWWRASRGALARARSGDDGLALCLCVSWVPFGLFAGLALIMDISAHWLAPCFLGALPLVGGWLTDAQRPRGRQLRAAVAIAVLFAAPLVAVPLLATQTGYLAPERDDEWEARLAGLVHGPSQVARRVRREAATRDGPLLIVTGDYHSSSLAAWHLREGDMTWPTLPITRSRFRQLQNWYREGMYDGWNALYIEEEDGGDAERLLVRSFEHVTRLDPEIVRVGDVRTAYWHVFYCEGFKGPLPLRQTMRSGEPIAHARAEGAAQSAERPAYGSWMERPRDEWPLIAMINQITYVDEHHPVAGCAFLLEVGDEVLAATAKHVLTDFKSAEMDAVHFKGTLKRWTMSPKDHSAEEVVVGELLNRDAGEALERIPCDKDWLLFTVRKRSEEVQPLRLRTTPLVEGEPVYVVGWRYTETDCAQIVYEGVYVRSDADAVVITAETLTDNTVGGLSGAPVIDGEGYLVGMMSRGKGELQRLSPVGYPREFLSRPAEDG